LTVTGAFLKVNGHMLEFDDGEACVPHRIVRERPDAPRRTGGLATPTLEQS
jgi:hypothetical protein